MASIRERKRADGTSVFAVLWRDSETGKQTSYPVGSPEEARNFKRLVESNGNSLTAVGTLLEKANMGGPTLAEAMARHIEMLTRAGPDQLRRYRRAIDNHFSGRLGKLPVAAVEHEDIVMWIREMQAKGMSAKTIANHHGTLSATMETSIRKKWRGDNPCKWIDLPDDNAIEEKMNFLTGPESLRVVGAMPERYRAFVLFLFGTGMRFGEATALKGSDFQLRADPPVVRVERAWKRNDDNRFYIGPPKTKKSRRSVSLADSVVRTIWPLVEKAGPHGLVFVTSYGGPIRHSTFHEFWAKGLDSLGYPKGRGNRPRIHDARHTHASLMLAHGMQINELSRRLGHESITTTVDRYSHLMPDAHFRGAEISEKALEMLPAVEVA
ncbi:tyrosine-type recombinase/integrase [Arthrobacter sp. USHLN218]|uniref:tyrosine-type recombinase/integrase n=1 Tax=Arthrobacter sp. USHLN218 TaxID=3081232 RepID=UPI00301B5495